MFLRMENSPERRLTGQKLRMSMADNRTAALWQGFMPRRAEISGRVNDLLISMQVYDAGHDPSRFDPQAGFDRWAAVEVGEGAPVPEGMLPFIIPAGLYAVFLHRGTSQEAPRTFGYIFGEWLPASGYAIAQRPHFEVLGAKYRNNGPASEEEIWIPVDQSIA
ncbi:MAG: GyrI-like domain-containing protein [Mucilaginibacter polytrichastri]|nr:GyrI-like domain-containing protein [Mucilaginibacter polytrichastri]